MLNDREEYFGYEEIEIDLMTMYNEGDSELFSIDSDLMNDGESEIDLMHSPDISDEELVTSSGYSDNLVSSGDNLMGYSDDLMGNRKSKK